MTIEDFKTYVKTRKPLDTEEIHRFMDEMSNESPSRHFPSEYGLSYAG